MENNTDTVIGINVSLKGNLHNKGSIQVNGSVEGEVRSEENVLIGETAKIKGPVIAKKVEISGEVKGVVEATEKLEINPTGKVFGDIIAKLLTIKEGAIFVGNSSMSAASAPVEEKVVDASDEKIEEKNLEPEKTDKMGFFGKK